MAAHKLSLVAQYDDLIRNTSVLTKGIEAEFITFVKNQESSRQQYHAESEQSKSLKRKLDDLEEENRALQTKLKHARLQIDREMTCKMKAEQDRDTIDRQIVMVRELLADKGSHAMFNDKDREKLAFFHSYSAMPSQHESPRQTQQSTNLSKVEETMSLSDISFDKSDEDLCGVSPLRSGRTWKRPAASPTELDVMPREIRRRSPHKRHRRSRSANHVITTTCVAVQESGEVKAEASIMADDKEQTVKHRSRSKSPHSTRRKLRKSKSEQQLKSLRDQGDSDDSQSPARYFLSPYKSPSEGRLLRHYNSGSKSLYRPHVFQSKTVLRSETCNPCGKRIKFGKPGMRCEDCRVMAHPECKDLVPLPCALTAASPIHTKTSGGNVLSDFAPLDPPYIPAIIIHCVNEVENRGFNEVGLYRVSGSDSKVKELKAKFLKMKGIPSLRNIDTHEICSCLKDFLRGLKDPLITRRLWHDFALATELSDKDEGLSRMYQAVSELPQANRDTLAFLILHFQRLAEVPECKMPLCNISKVVGPTIVGFSQKELEPMQMINEAVKQSVVMEYLLNVSADYWENFVNVEDDTSYKTPEIRPAMRSMLGPIGTPDAAGGDSSEKRNWFGTLRRGGKNTQGSKKQGRFFASPRY